MTTTTATATTSTIANFATTIAFPTLGGLLMKDVRATKFAVGISDGLLAGFTNGTLLPGLTEFLLSGEEKYPFNDSQIEAIIVAKMGKFNPTPAMGFVIDTLALEYGQALKSAFTDIDAVSETEDAYLASLQTTQVAEEAVIDPIEQLLDETVAAIDKSSIYDSFFQAEAVISDAEAIQAKPEVVPQTELMEPELVEITTEDLVEVPESAEIVTLEKEVSRHELIDANFQDSSTEQEVEVPFEQALAETLPAVQAHLELVQEEKMAIIEAMATPVIAPESETPKVAFVNPIPEGKLEEVIAHMPSTGILAHVQTQPRELKQVYTQTLSQSLEQKASKQRKKNAPSRQKTAAKFAQKQASKAVSAMAEARQPRQQAGSTLHVGMVPHSVIGKDHCVYPYLGNMPNIGQPCGVSLISLSVGNGRYATAGNHSANHDPYFQYPSTVIAVQEWDRFTNKFFERQITVPYIIKAPINLIEVPNKGLQPNLVIADCDTVQACRPIWVNKSESTLLVEALNQGATIIGEYKPFKRQMPFVVLLPANPKWVSLNSAVDTSVDYPAK